MLKISKVDVDLVARELEVKETLGGKLDLHLDVRGLGGSVAEVMAGLNSKTLIVASKGRISNKYINLLGSDISSSLFRLLNPFGREISSIELNCFVSAFDITNGIAHSTALVFDTNYMSVVGEGEINLKTEALDISLKPSLKDRVGVSGIGRINMGLGELAKPFKLSGTLAKPSLAVDPTQTALTIGQTLGGAILFGPVGIAAFLASGSANGCNACVAAIDAGKKGVKVSVDKTVEEIEGAARKVAEAARDKLKGILGR